MPLIHRDFALGDLKKLNLDATALTALRVTPKYNLAISGDEMVSPESVMIAIAEGIFVDGDGMPLNSSITGGQVYQFDLFGSTGGVIMTFPSAVSAASTSVITLAEIYADNITLPDPVTGFVREGDLITRLASGDVPDGYRVVSDGEGGLEFIVPPVTDADMRQADYGGSDANTVRNSDALAGHAPAYFATAASVTTEASARAAADSAEASARAAADAALQGNIDLKLNANDASVTNARAPTAHHATHEPGGTDAMAVDAAAGTGSLRTLGTGAQQAAPGNHAHSNATTSTAGFESAADKTKLDGIATGATANATDVQLRDRSTHTGTQAAGTITGLGDAAAKNTGTTPGTVAAGNDTRFPASVTGLRKGAGAGSSDTAAVAGTDYLTPTGDGSQLTNLPAGGQSFYCTVADQKTLGTHGGTFTAGADRQRVLNTVINNYSGHTDAQLLPPGTNTVKLFSHPTKTTRYEIHVWGLTTEVDDNAIFVKHSDGSVIPGPYSVERNTNAGGVNMRVMATVHCDVASGVDSDAQIWAACDTTINTVGFGNAMGGNVSTTAITAETYAVMRIWSMLL